MMRKETEAVATGFRVANGPGCESEVRMEEVVELEDEGDESPPPLSPPGP